MKRSDRALLDAVYLAGEHGITVERLIDKAYADDPDGGPESARKVIHVRVCRLNKILRERGWSIHGRGAHSGIYVLEKMTVDADLALSVIRRALEPAT